MYILVIAWFVIGYTKSLIANDYWLMTKALDIVVIFVDFNIDILNELRLFAEV